MVILYCKCDISHMCFGRVTNRKCDISHMRFGRVTNRKFHISQVQFVKLKKNKNTDTWPLFYYFVLYNIER